MDRNDNHQMKRLAAWTALCLCLCASLAWAAPEATVTLKHKACITGREVLLKEVAVLESANLDILTRLEQVSLGYSPEPGYTRYLTADNIASGLRTRGIAPEEINLMGAEGVLISVKSTLVTGDDLARLAVDFLKNQVRGMEGERTIESPRRPADLLVPVGKGLSSFQVQWQSLPRTQGPVTVDVQIFVDGSLFTTVPVQCNVRLFDRVLVATEDIQRGEAFTLENTTVMRSELTFVRGRAAQSVKEMAPFQAKRRVQAGKIVSMDDGFLPDLVFRGKTVNVTVRKGALTLRARGLARQNGSKGDTVAVLNSESGKTFQAVVVGLDQVEVQL